MELVELQRKLTPGFRLGWKRTLFGVDKHVLSLKRSLFNLVENSESFNVIVMGPRGCGKNTFVETCLYQASEENQNFYSRRRIIRLNGIICGRNLRAAVNEIFSCLKVSESFEDKHLSSFEDRLDSIMELLRNKLAKKSSKSKICIFVLDNLEYFCEGVQLLLYNLFDACSSGNGLLGVIGITSSVNITELFEKRVKSRFSHRIINLTGFSTFEEYAAMATVLMSLENREEWNKSITSIMSSSDVQKTLRQLFDTDKSIGQLVLFLYEVIVTSKGIDEIPNNVSKTWTRFNTSSKVQQCLDLTTYDMMVILAIRLMHPNSFQFDNLWQQISKLAQKFKAERTDLQSCIVTLESAELIVPVKMRGKQLKKADSTFYRSNLSFDELNTVLKTYPNLPSDFQEYLPK